VYVVVRCYRAAAIDGPVQLPFGRPSSSAVRRERNFRFTSGRLVPYTVARSVGPHTEAGTNSGSLVNGNFPVFFFYRNVGRRYSRFDPDKPFSYGPPSGQNAPRSPRERDHGFRRHNYTITAGGNIVTAARPSYLREYRRCRRPMVAADRP